MEDKKAQIKYSKFIELLEHNFGDLALEQMKDWEITVVDDNGQTVGKFVLDDDKLKT